MTEDQEEAERRRRHRIMAGREESVGLVRYSADRGMRLQTMYKIWGRPFVDACLVVEE